MGTQGLLHPQSFILSNNRISQTTETLCLSCCSHATALTRLESCEVKCGGCSMRLRLWSLNTGRQSFICSDTGLVSPKQLSGDHLMLVQGCPQVGRYVISTGTNWFTCYKCSYDLCVACVHRRLDRVSREDIIMRLVLRLLGKLRFKLTQ